MPAPTSPDDRPRGVDPGASRAQSDPLALIGHALAGKYHVDKMLGKGGMGAVYLATHLGTDRPVALKVIAPEFMAQGEFVERFRREARAAGRLRHPNVVNVTDFGFAEHRGRQVAYLVMEHLDGCTLGELLRREGALPLLQVVDIVEQMCLALTEAHRRGVIHRDLKPDNIWLEDDGRGGHTVKVLDFGLAKLKRPEVDASVSGVREAARSRAAASSSRGELDIDAHARTAAALRAAGEGTRADADERDATLSSRRVVDAPPDHALAPDNMPSRTGMMARADAAPSASSSLAVEATLLARHGAPRRAGADATDSGDGLGARRPEPTLPALRSASTERGPASASLELSPLPPSIVTAAGEAMGTPAYMSPEQCLGKSLDERTDLYSLGVMTYEMLANQRPFSGDATRLIHCHTSHEPPPLRRRARGVPRAVSRFVMSTLAKDPAKRPRSAASFAASLRAHSEGVWRLLQRALLLYTEHFVRLTSIGAAILLLPTLAAKLLTFPWEHQLLAQSEAEPRVAQVLFIQVFHVQLQLVFLSLFTPVVARLERAPLSQPRVLPLLAVVRARARAIVRTMLRLVRVPLPLSLLGGAIMAAAIRAGDVDGPAALIVIAGLLLLVVSTLWMAYLMVRYWVCIPVIIMEGREGKDAIDRTRELTRGALGALLFVAFMTSVLNRLAYGEAGRNVIDEDSTAWNLLVSKITGLPAEVILAIIMALTYFRLRQARGDTVQHILDRYLACTPSARWR